MITFVQILFWIIIPCLCIYLKFKKEYTFGFTFAGICASFLLGVLFMGTFIDTSEEKFVALMNQEKIEEAKRELQIILQKNPSDIQKIETQKIVNLDAFNKMKRELENSYLEIVNKTIDSFELNENVECKDLQDAVNDFSNLKNMVRLLNMAENLGQDQGPLHDKLAGMQKEGKLQLEKLKKRCSEENEGL